MRSTTTILSQLVEATANALSSSTTTSPPKYLWPTQEEIERIGPRNYVLPVDDKEFSAYILGDWGERGEGQLKVATLMEATFKEQPAQYCFGTGDNFYPKGVETPTDERFNTTFYQVYRKKLPETVFIHALGNHDHVLDVMQQKLAEMVSPSIQNMFFYPAILKSTPVTGEKRALNQVAHTYMSETAEGLQQKMKAFGLGEAIDKPILLDKPPTWTMPYYFSSYTCGKIIFFVLDSNTILRYFLNSHALSKHNLKKSLNQVDWLIASYAQSKIDGKIPVLVQHHPLRPYGKRAHKEDAGNYLSPVQITQLDLIFKLDRTDPMFQTNIDNILSVNDESLKRMAGGSLKNTANYHHLLRQLYQHLNTPFRLSLTGHEHNMYFSVDKNGAELATGTGGGGIQNRANVNKDDNEDLACFFSEFGFGALHWDYTTPDRIYIDTYTIDGMHLRFADNSIEPIRKINTDPKVEELRRAVIKQYKKQITSHLMTTEQMRFIHYAWNYVNQYEIGAYDAIIKAMVDARDKFNVSSFCKEFFSAIALQLVFDGEKTDNKIAIDLNELTKIPEPASFTLSGWLGR